MTLFPVTPTPVTRSSSYTSETGEYSTPSGSCLRRSTRIINTICDIRIQRKGVRLFQERSIDIENENEGGNSNDGLSSVNLVSASIPNENEGSNVPFTRSNKRVTRSSSINDDESEGELEGKSAKRRTSANAPTGSTPARGSNAIPVTPEPVGSGSTRLSRKKLKTEVESVKIATTKGRLKTTTKVKAKTKARKTTAKTKNKASRVIVSWPAPDGWRETYELVRELRKDKTSPCDMMGAEALGLTPPNRNDNGDMDTDDEEFAKTSRFHTLIALMLSSQTKDAMVGQAMGNLRDKSDRSGGLTVASILEMDPKVLNAKIYSVGFRNNKTKYIKQVAQILRDDYNDDVPPTADEMIRNLPGIGPKMAYIIENICWDKQTGIGVDTHMQRLFPRIGWVSPNTKNPEQTRKQLESWLPHEYWGEVNLLWVGFGQEVQQEKQKVLRKALQSDRPFEALNLLRSVDFDVVKEWNKMQSVGVVISDEEKKENFIWTDDDEKKKIDKMIEEVASKN